MKILKYDKIIIKYWYAQIRKMFGPLIFPILLIEGFDKYVIYKNIWQLVISAK